MFHQEPRESAVVELQRLQIIGTSSGPHVLITGGVHGDEFEPMAAIRRLHAMLQGRPVRGQVTLVPVVNEAAFRRGNRVGDDGLDLARTCPGRADGSLTEQTAHALSELIRSADFYIDLHTGGLRLQVLPLVGYMLHPEAHVLDWQRKMAHAFGLPIIWGTDYRLNGRSLSVARDAGVPAIYAEYLGGGGCDPSGVAACVKGCLNVLELLGVIERSAPLPAAGIGLCTSDHTNEESFSFLCLGREGGRRPTETLVVEDSRPNAGYMQINHAAPIEGFFESAVHLGQRIEQGQPLGTVCDVLGNDVRAVLAERTGIVLVLHTFARVDAGECLGVILETEQQRSP